MKKSAALPATLTIMPVTDEQHIKLRRLRGRARWDRTLAYAAGISVKTLRQAHPSTRMAILAAVLPLCPGPEVLKGVEIEAHWLPEASDNEMRPRPGNVSAESPPSLEKARIINVND